MARERKMVDATFRCIDEDFLFPGKMEYVGHDGKKNQAASDDGARTVQSELPERTHTSH